MLKESKTLEFKKEMSDTFLKTVSAFANFGTGTIMFGVTDEGNIVGINDMKNLRLDIENKINSNIEPIPDYRFEEDEKNMVLKLIVEEGADKPYFYKSKSYMRKDTSTIEIDKITLKKMIMDSDNISFDSLKSSSQELKFSILEKALKDKIAISSFTIDTMKTFELYSDSEGYNNGAALFADTNKFEGVDIARFGENINIFLDRVRLNRISIIEQYNKAVEKFIQYYTYEEVEGFYRVKKEKIPEDAFREAIANALINRDWDSSANIQASFFDDRIEITSPGGLPKGVTKEDYLHKELSIPKNPIIANVFFRLGLIERYGTGVQRIQALYKGSTSQPNFEVSENLIKIVLPLLKSTAQTTQTLTDKTAQTTINSDNTTPKTTPNNDNTTPKTTPNNDNTTPNNDNTTPKKTIDTIIALIKSNNKITATEIADKVGLTRDGVRYHLDNMKSKGMIKHCGTVQNGYWEILIED